MRLHCYQASQRPSMTTDRPHLPMSHIDSGIGSNISMCVQRCRCHVWMEQQIFLTTNVIDRQTHTKHNNIAKVIHKYGQNKDKREKGT